MKSLNWIFFLLFLTNCANTSNNTETVLNIEESQLIDYLFSTYSGKTPGLSYVVIKEGEIVRKESYGFANLEDNISSKSKTNYRIASVSKQFTAMAIMILEHQGKLSYETKLTEIFPDFPAYGNNINIRHLITHQSGVIDYDQFIIEGRTEQLLDAEVLEGLKKMDSTYFIPGSEYRYSNSAYAVLAQIVEKVSGNSFAHFMKQEIFIKLGMSQTSVFELNKTITNRAFGYSLENDSIKFNDQSVTSAIQGDGGIYSNVLDYYKWDQALYTNRLLPKNKIEEAFYDWNDNVKTQKEGYGYGWYIDFENDIKVLNHSGGTVGFASRVSRIPSLNLTIAIFSNHDGHDRNLMHKVNALTSIYSEYKISMPIDIIMKKEIDQKNVKSGIKIYDKLKSDPKYTYGKTTLGYLGAEYYRMEKLEEAKVLFLKSIDEFPDYFGGYFGLGRLYKKLGETEKSKLNFQKVIELELDEEPWIFDYVKTELEKLK